MAQRKGYEVPAVVRTMGILEFLAHLNRGASVTEISRDLRFPKSSTYLVMRTLEEQGYLQKDMRTGKYYFRVKLAELGRKFLAPLDLRELARPSLSALARQTGIIVHLAVLQGTEAVIIERIVPGPLSAGADWVSRRLDINCTGVGKALFAHLPEEQFNKIASSKRFARHNDNTIVTISGLRKELARVRELGYAVDDEEDEIGVRCIGVPVFDNLQRVAAAVSLAGTVDEIPVDRVPTLACAVKKTALEISFRLECLAWHNSTEPDTAVLQTS